MTYVAMLRGITVGGHNRVPMADLRDLVASLGYTDVRTYVQSGNVVFEGGPSERNAEVAQRLAQAVRSRFALAVPVVVRTGDQLARVLTESPFTDDGLRPEDDPAASHVTYLATPPDPAPWTALATDAERFAPDACRLVGADVHLHLPGGRYSDSKLTNAYFERMLAVVATIRNWKTVGALAEMAAVR